MRLIDADRLLRDPYFQEDRWPESHLIRMAVREQRTVDAVPVVHGRWENLGEHRRMDLRCSVCGNRADKFVGGTEDWYCLWKPAYCPNCGAKMDLEVENR